MLQNILDWLHDMGPLGMFIHSFADAIIFPVPAFVLQVSLSILDPSSALWLATIGYIACILGTPFGYLIGKLAGDKILNKILKKSWIDSATHMFQKNGEMAILIGSFTPIPFKVFTILSGFLHFPLWRLIAYAAIGRAVKFYVVGVLFYLYGRAAEGMAKDVSLYVGLCAIPLIAAFIYYKRKKSKKAEADHSNG
ncbi:YqaA family protein [Brevibacillus invocatus]|uniref:YqaA family protein n=1 Tax=Brevibacillus invocatus TaxID=173959 RepID=UPI00203B6228|nr:VTT domain-containing protein [Brevibacillus invocatus]MCM3081837.1 VTT domain-containing protein [Brevibacillus invocatus]MCM3432244.1 VTT domain-containing protein [Brevibacillus invocatus]